MANFFEDSQAVGAEDDIVILHNQVTDKDEEFYHLATIDVDKKWYIIMKPVDKLADIADDEVLIYEIIANAEGDDFFAPIEDADLLTRVFDEFVAEVEKSQRVTA